MSFMKRALSRRTLLRGAGVAFALPLLDAMIPANTAMAATVANPSKLRRLGYVYIPMGFNPEPWVPEGDRLDKLPFTLQPLEKIKSHVTVVSGMELKNAYPGSHATSNAAFLSAATARRTESSDYYLGTTVDQIAAQHLGQNTQLPSLELAMDLLNNVGQCDNGYACVYQNNLSWSSPTTPLPAEAHPRLVFENLFGEGGTPEARRDALKRRASLLDSVSEEMRRFQLDLGAGDRNKVEQYFESVREVERRIQRAEANVADIDRGVASAKLARYIILHRRDALFGGVSGVGLEQQVRSAGKVEPEVDPAVR